MPDFVIGRRRESDAKTDNSPVTCRASPLIVDLRHPLPGRFATDQLATAPCIRPSIGMVVAPVAFDIAADSTVSQTAYPLACPDRLRPFPDIYSFDAHAHRHSSRCLRVMLYQTTRYVASPARDISPKLMQGYKQVAGELRKMTAFIRQEALEKAREIQLKADEEFAIEKSKLVRQETSAIDTQYEKKFKQAAMSQQITRSTLANRTRLRVLSSRQELLDDLFQRSRDKISGVAAGDAKKYESVLKGLVLEGLYALNEEKIQVRGRKKDYKTLKQAMKEAEKEFKDKVGKDVVVELDEAEPLPDGA